jgi:hypothetical protein
MSVNKLMYLLHLHVFLSFLQIIWGFDYPEKHISQPIRIIGSLLYSALKPHLQDIIDKWCKLCS